MDTKELHLVVVSPEHTLYDGVVDWVELPGEKGRFQVLRNHAALISSLVKGNVSYVEKGASKSHQDPQTIAITGGFAEIKDNLVSVCVEQ